MRQLVESHDPATHMASLGSQVSRLLDSSAGEVKTVRKLVEQQTALLEAFVHAAERMSGSGKSNRSNAVVDAVQSQFEQLQKKKSDSTR